MSEETLVKKKARSLLSVMTAALLTTGGVMAAPAVALADEGPVAEPQITVTPSEDLDPAEEHTLTVEGTGFVGEGAAMGAYVLFGEQSVWSGGEALEADGWIAQDWVQASKITDGSFSTELTVPADSLEPGTEYHVATSAAHGLSKDDRSLDAFAPVTVLQEEEPEVPVADPQLVVEPSENLDPTVDNTLTVTGTGYVGEDAAFGAYVLFGTDDIWSGEGALVADGWIDQQHISAGSIEDGEFTTKIEIPADTLERDETYQVATSAAHHLSMTQRSLDAFAEVTVLQEEEPETPEDTTPAVTIEGLENGEVRQGEELTFSGTGFEAGDLVTVTVNSDPVVVAEDSEVDENGEVSATWTVPNEFALGAHTVVFAVDGENLAEAEFSVLAAAAADDTNTPETGDENNNANPAGQGDDENGNKLAHTGGEATAIFVLAGLSLLVGTGAMLARMRKAKLEI